MDNIINLNKDVDNILEKGYNLCRSFLGGSWSSVPIDKFHIETISGGLSNLIYHCYLEDSVQLEPNEPREVLLRIYGKIIKENPDTVITDSIVSAILSENQIGPRLYGVFQSGRIEEFFKSRNLRTKELHQPLISAGCASILARLHQFSMPLCKQPRWLHQTLTRYLDEALNNVTFQHFDHNSKYQKLLSYGLANEMQQLRNMILNSQSPIVFCHNDLQEGNIMLMKNADDSVKLVPIDFEYASYNYRGYDIANHLVEWCYDYSHNRPPYFLASIEDFPSEDQQLCFIRTYLDNCQSVDDRDSAEQQLLQEIRIFTLASHFLWGLWSIIQTQMSSISFGYMEYAMVRFEHYFQQKKQWQEEGNCRLNGGLN